MIGGLLDYRSAGLSPSRWIASLGRSADRAADWSAASWALPALKPVPPFAGEFSMGELLSALAGGAAERRQPSQPGAGEPEGSPVFEAAGFDEAAGPAQAGMGVETSQRGVSTPLPAVPAGGLSEARLRGLAGQAGPPEQLQAFAAGSAQAGLDRPARAQPAGTPAGAGLAQLRNLLSSPRRLVPPPAVGSAAGGLQGQPDGQNGRERSPAPDPAISPLAGGGRPRPVESQGGHAPAGRRARGWEAPATVEILQRLPYLAQKGSNRSVGGPAAPLGLLEGLARTMDALPSLQAGLRAGAGARAFQPAWVEGETTSGSEMELETGGEAHYPAGLELAGVRQARVSGERMKPGLAEGQRRSQGSGYPAAPFRTVQPQRPEPAVPEAENHTPAQRNIFNVTIHQGGGFEDETELADRLARILIDQARRHGIDVS